MASSVTTTPSPASGVDEDIAEKEEFVLEIVHDVNALEEADDASNDEEEENQQRKKRKATDADDDDDDDDDDVGWAAVAAFDDSEDFVSPGTPTASPNLSRAFYDPFRDDGKEDAMELAREEAKRRDRESLRHQILRSTVEGKRKKKKKSSGDDDGSGDDDDDDDSLVPGESMLPTVVSGGGLERRKVEVITMENPRIWFGQPSFGVVREKDPWKIPATERDGKPRYERRAVLPNGREVALEEAALADPDPNVDSGAPQAMEGTFAAGFLSPFSSKANRIRKRRQENADPMAMNLLGLDTGGSRGRFRSRRRRDSSAFPKRYRDTFVYSRDQYAVTRDRIRAEKKVRDVERVSQSFFGPAVAAAGRTKMELVMYKQSVKRRHFSWDRTPVYIEKLRFVWNTTVMDLGFRDPMSWEFYLMLAYLVLVFVFRAYPHYLGQWLWLSIFNTNFRTPFARPWYIRFYYRTEERTSWFNFSYLLSGNVFNMLLSLFFAAMTFLAQLLFDGLPSLVYRSVFLFLLAVCFDPLLTFIPDVIAGAIYPSQTPYGEAFVLADYYDTMEDSSLPGILLTIMLYVPFVFLQITLLYQYVLRVHTNCRILDVYRRLNKSERHLYIPHDLEISRSQFDLVVEDSKDFNVGGMTKKVLVSEMPLDLRDSTLLRRLEDILGSKAWPHDYIQKCIEKESPFYDQGRNVVVPQVLLDDPRPSALVASTSSIGKQFRIRDVAQLANAVFFDEIDNTTIKERRRMLEKLFRRYGIISGRQMLDRFRRNKSGVVCSLIAPTLFHADVLRVTDTEFEMDVPTMAEIKKETGFGPRMWCNEYIRKPFLQRFRYRGRILPVDFATIELQRKKELEELEERYVRKDVKAYHIEIADQDVNGRFVHSRHFVQTPTGSICEVFDSLSLNQLSFSNIALPDSVEYWVKRTLKKVKTDERERRQAHGSLPQLEDRVISFLSSLTVGSGVSDALARDDEE